MAITTPSEVQITPSYELLVPAVAQYPVRRALENLNYLWRYHRPGHVIAGYTSNPELTRTATYHSPIRPSADGLPYSFEHRLVCSAASQGITVTVKYCTTYAGTLTAWTDLYTAAATSSGSAGGLTTFQHGPYTIPATATALQVSYTAPAAGNRTDHHLLVYPTPSDAVAGVTASDFCPSDDTLLTSAQGAAMHTEWVNRCKRSARAVLQDRRQCALSFLQEAPGFATRHSRTDKTAWFPYPPGRVWLPFQAEVVTLDFDVIGTVTGGATADLIRVRQLGVANGKSTTFAASDATSAGQLEVRTQVFQGGGLLRFADLEIAVKTTSGNTTRPHAVVGWYTPGQ